MNTPKDTGSNPKHNPLVRRKIRNRKLPQPYAIKPSQWKPKPKKSYEPEPANSPA